MRLRRAFSLLAFFVALGACTGASDVTTTVTEPDTTTTNPLSLSPTQVVRELRVVFQSDHFLVTVGDAVYDSDDGLLYLGLRFENLADSPVSIAENGQVVIDGQSHHISIRPLSMVPAGSIAEVTGIAQVGTDPFQTGQLIWGPLGENQTSVALIDGSATGFGPPIDFPVEAWAMVGRFTVHFAAGRIYADGVRGFEVPSGQHMIRLEFDEYTSTAAPISGFHPQDHFDLVWPDGTVVESIGGSTGRQGMAWTMSTANSVDFPVPADPHGEYQVVFRGAGRHAIGVLRPELVQKLMIPLTVPDISDRGPIKYTGNAPPLPDLPGARRHVQAFDSEIQTEEVNHPGFAFRATRVSWDPATQEAVIEGLVRLLPTAAPPADGLFSAPAQFAPSVHLEFRGRLHPGALDSIPEVPSDAQVPVTLRFHSIEELDPDAATVFLTVGGVLPATLPLGAEATYPLQPVAPDLIPVDGPTVTAGNYQVTVVGYRFGLPNRLDQPPVEKRSLELTFDVTAHQVENPGAFGLQFDPRSQLFLTGDDGYLQQPDNFEGVYLEDGQTVRMSASYYVRADWEPGPLVITVRSISIQAFDLQWTEATFTVSPRTDGSADT